ncbi:velvet factor-domain-containing protein [Multifurca ochricompacta]|uniref:Velvet factor-domain-containing protein n=1 Tax=Multifurca ochricompacta TaxID=376703 RepID=A0AAD4M0L3_9AGAM|nr:velvet factor-domain-containing protein [Multifurca ochricompacta]
MLITFNRSNVYHCKSIFSSPFYVYTAKKFPGMEESTALSCSLADQGIKIRIRKDIRQRKPRSGITSNFPITNGQPLGPGIPIQDEESDQESEVRHDDHNDTTNNHNSLANITTKPSNNRKRPEREAEKDRDRDRDRDLKRPRVDDDEGEPAPNPLRVLGSGESTLRWLPGDRLTHMSTPVPRLVFHPLPLPLLDILYPHLPNTTRTISHLHRLSITLLSQHIIPLTRHTSPTPTPASTPIRSLSATLLSPISTSAPLCLCCL